ncbi:MAG: aryl-sulfate sulfotransferase [Planctomycetaceae bacterium]|nr:aryl-sulfate sulfotransferase [Planctomycetaceae bacterium]
MLNQAERSGRVATGVFEAGMKRSHILLLWLLCAAACAQDKQEPLPPLPTVGVTLKAAEATPGYTLISPLSTNRVFLLNNDGLVVHYWDTDRKPGQSAYLLEDGTLVRGGKVQNFFQFPSTTGSGGSIQKYDWDSNLLWSFVSSSQFRMSHHDIEPLPNGNILCIVWESYLKEVAVKAGRDPERLQGEVLWFEAIFELKPKGDSEADIVWKWSLLDHVVQNLDEDADNFGQPAEHPELVDINFMHRPVADWIHMNSIDYNEKLDQIVVGSRTFSEFWIIDHSTTTDEAKGHTGGRYGHGGDLLYRWGNPRAWGMGDFDDRQLFNQHDVHWIPEGLPGAGHILLFNNGLQNTEQNFSSADELVLPQNEDGTYRRADGRAFGPEKVSWTFEDPGNLFSPRISGAQRLPGGNTLICSGTQHLLVEVTPNARPVWSYKNPPRFRHPPPVNRTGRPSDSQRKPSLSDVPEERLKSIRIKGGVPLEDGGTMFRAIKYPADYPAFAGKDLSVKNVPRPQLELPRVSQ